MARPVIATLSLLAAVFTGAAGIAYGRGVKVGPPGGSRPVLRVTYLALDHGNATLIQPPGGTGILSGTGGPGDLPEVLRFLKRQGIQELNALFIGTWSEKYVAGGPALLKRIPIHGVVQNPIYVHTRNGDALENIALAWDREKKLGLHAPAPGETTTFFYAPLCQLRMAGPTGPMLVRFKDDPDCSMLTEISIERISIFDLGETARRHQKVFWSQVEDKPLGQVLVIGRNGAADALDPTLLKPLRTRFAIFPIPRKSGKGPAPETLAALKRAGVRVYRTDRQGAITVTTDGVKIDVKTGV